MLEIRRIRLPSASADTIVGISTDAGVPTVVILWQDVKTTMSVEFAQQLSKALLDAKTCLDSLVETMGNLGCDVNNDDTGSAAEGVTEALEMERKVQGHV